MKPERAAQPAYRLDSQAFGAIWAAIGALILNPYLMEVEDFAESARLAVFAAE